MKTSVVIVPARPDIFNTELRYGPGGRAALVNVTNTVHTTEPFVIRTIQRKGNRLGPSVLRLTLTGIQNTGPGSLSIRIRESVISSDALRSSAVLIAPGVYTVDFELPAALEHAGDQPIVVTVNAGTNSYSSRLDDTAARLFIL